MQRIPYDTMRAEFKRVLDALGFAEPDAATLAQVFADNSCDGVPSHGLNRFPGFVRAVQAGRVDRDARAHCVASLGAMEQWDGRRGPGVLNALASMGRAIELARTHGLGAVALRNTSHWMRAGTYGLQAADAGCIGLCWTNTTPLMPPHGGTQNRLGNNPLVIGVPAASGEHLLLDMAISQFSGGRTAIHKRTGEPFPVPGGYNADGQLTTDAAAIERVLPVGYWKGSGLALGLDLVAALASGGQTTAELAQHQHEAGVSQLFLAFNLDRLGSREAALAKVDAALADLTSSQSLPGQRVTYPGQAAAERRRTNRRDGVPVDEHYWQQVIEMPEPTPAPQNTRG